MKEPAPETPPSRGDLHDALEVFVGRWRAEGWSYADPKERWLSTVETRWHTGGFFLLQDERSYSGEDTSGVFETHSVYGVEPATNGYFAHNFENHGFFRLYRLARSGKLWTFDGDHERARYEFSADDREITIHWELRKDGQWQPLCDRVARKI